MTENQPINSFNYQQQSSIQNECRNCKMKFDNPQSLANHVRKFCSEGNYGDVKRLDQRLQQLGSKPLVENANLNFQDIRNYLKGDNQVNPQAQQSLQQMNLDDLRNYFQSENQSYEELQRQAIRQKERHLMDEVEKYKREKQEIRLARLEQDRALAELMKEVELKRDRELRARAEKQQIQKALAEIERNKMTVMEREKRRELERLAQERENLRLKEEQVIEDIRNLEAKMEDRARFEEETRQKFTQRNLENQGTNPRRKEIELAKERGEHIAALQLKRDMLEKDRQRIMEDLEKVQAGDMQTLRRNEASRWAANDILQRNPSNMGVDLSKIKLDPALKDKLLLDEVRIRQLKEQRDKTLREFVPESDDLDPLTRNFAQTEQTYVQPLEFQRLKSDEPAGPRTRPSPQRDSPSKMKSIHKSNKVKFDQGQVENLDMAQKLQKLKDDYKSMGEDDPELYAYLKDLENHILRKEPLQKPYQYQQQPSYNGPQQTYQAPPHPQPLYQNTLLQSSGYVPQPVMPTMQPPIQPPIFHQSAPVYQPPPQMPIQPQQQLPPQPNPYSVPPLPIHNFFQQPINIQDNFETLDYQEPPQIVQRNEDIDRFATLIREQEMQNQLLEQQLNNLKSGNISFDQFERMLTDPAFQEIEKTKRQVLGKQATQKSGLPDDFRFRQNDFRAEDMEVEERMLANIAAQEFDQLRILSKIPKNSDLYKHKMQQYKEMSAMRAEMEKVLQEQKLEKLRRDFEKKKHEDMRQFEHERWVEDQQKAIIEAKLAFAAQPQLEPEYIYEQQPEQQIPQYQFQPQPQYYQPQRQMKIDTPFEPEPDLTRKNSFFTEEDIPAPQIKSQQTLEPPPIQQEQKSPLQQKPPASNRGEQRPSGNEIYNPQNGFNVYFDFISRIQRQYRSMRIVYAVYNVQRALIPPSLVDIHDAEPDPEDPNEKNRIIFKEYATIKNVQPHPSSNFVMEIQVPKPNTGSHDKFVSFGWTLINLFDYQYQFNKGIFRLPIYQSPTKADIDIRDIQQLQRIPETVLLFRIGNPGDNNCTFQWKPTTTPEEYYVPRIHQFQGNQMENMGSINNLEIPVAQEVIPINPNYTCNGVRIYVHFAKNYVPGSYSKIQLTLYEGQNIVRTDDGRMCNWASKQFDSQNLLFSMPTNPVYQGLGIQANEIARGEIIAIDDETSWLKDIYRIQFNQQGTKNQTDLSLVIQIMENRGRPGIVGQDYQALAYGVLRLNNPDGTIRYGLQDIPLFKPPVNLTKRNPSDLVKQTLKITISPPLNQSQYPQQQQPQKQPQQQQQPVSQGRPQQQPNQFQQQPPPQQQPQFQDPSLHNDRPFIQNLAPQGTNPPFKVGDGIDFYIDGARFLPENTTYSRAILKVLSIDQAVVVKPLRKGADLDMSTSWNPFYMFRYEIRGQKLDSSMVAQITIETIDRSDMQPKVVGYAYFPLFLNSGTRGQSVDKNSANIMMQDGCYQLPLYYDKLVPGVNLTLDNIQKQEKIPCATVLIRSYKAPTENGKVLGLQDVNMQDWKTKGVIIDPPLYSQGVYSTHFCQVNAVETDLYDVKADRSSPQMRNVTAYLQRVKGSVPSGNDMDLMRWLDQQMITNVSTPQINLRYFSGYQPRVGFRFSLERLHNLQSKMPHIVVTSIGPPAHLYGAAPKKTPDQSLFCEYKPDTHWNSLQFTEDTINYVGLPMTIKLGFIIDVKAVKYVSGTTVELVDVGWSFCAIYSILQNEDDSQSLYCHSGLHALPLLPGPVPEDIQNFITKTPQNVMNLLKFDKNNKILDGPSVILRIHDNQREWMPPKGYLQDINNQYLPSERMARFAIPQQQPIASVADQARTIIPPALLAAKDTFKTAVQAAFTKRYRV